MTGVQTCALPISAREIAQNGDEYAAGVHDVPDDLDREIAEIKLHAEGVEFDSLSDEQAEYLSSWDHGT